MTLWNKRGQRWPYASGAKLSEHSLVHSQSDSVIDAGVNDLAHEIADRVCAPKHGNELETTGEGRVGGPCGPVIVPASLVGSSIGDVVGGHAGTPGKADLCSRAASLSGVGLVGGGRRRSVGRRVGRSLGGSIRVGGRGRVGAVDTNWLLLDAALPILVRALALHDPVMVGRVSTTGAETIAAVDCKSVRWADGVDENTESKSGGGEEDVEESHWVENSFFITKTGGRRGASCWELRSVCAVELDAGR